MRRKAKPKKAPARAAAWRRIDLHLHTPASSDYQEPNVTWLDILQRAEARGLDIIGVTDHNTVTGYRRLRAEIDELELLELVELDELEDPPPPISPNAHTGTAVVVSSHCVKDSPFTQISVFCIPLRASVPLPPSRLSFCWLP